MSKIVKNYNFKKASFGSEGYKDLSGFTELNAETGKTGELRVMISKDSKKVGISKNLYSALGEPEFVKVLISDTQIAIRVVSESTAGAYELRKGAVIYSTSLAEKIMELASSVEFKPNATTRCGRIELLQTDEDDSVTIILSFD